MRISGVAALLLLALTASCKATDATGPQTELTISGAVTDVSTGSPIAGATITLETIEFLVVPSVALLSTVSDPQGRYNLSYSAEGECLEIMRLRVIAEGYGQNFSRELEGNGVKCTRANQVLNVRLTRNVP